MDQREEGILAICGRLGRPPEYATALVERVLTDDEVCRIAQHGRNPSGAVAIAAIIYQARRRMGEIELANREADRHHAVICDSVPLQSARNAKKKTKRIRKTPGIRTVPTPEPIG